MAEKIDMNNESIVDPSSSEEIKNSEEICASLINLNAALRRIIRVSTSRVQLSPDDPSKTQFVDIEGIADERTLELLEESISDVISWDDNKTTPIASPRSCSTTTTLRESRVTNDDVSSQQAISSTTTSGSFYSIPSCTSSFDGIVDPEALKKAHEAIEELEFDGPAGLIHLSSLSNVIGRPIRVWTSNGESRKVGRTKTGETVNTEYHEPIPEPHRDESVGHWTHMGNLESHDVTGELNDCLFRVVADQTGRLAPDLRAETLVHMRRNVRSLANRICALAKREKCDRISLLVGGARYNGERPQDAQRVIDNSQKNRCHPGGLYGHPRGHASHPGASGATESAENYSMTGRKSAFLSREDQDAVGHLVLETRAAQDAMEQLNRGETSVAVRLRPADLAPGPLPEGLEFSGGVSQGGPRPIREFLVVLRHHQGQQNNPEADVFVHTFYPILG